MALDYMSIASGGLFPTSPADTVERHEHAISRGLFIDFPGYVVAVTGNIFSFVRRGARRIFHQWKA